VRSFHNFGAATLSSSLDAVNITNKKNKKKLVSN
jgi:hypothetical protein